MTHDTNKWQKFKEQVEKDETVTMEATAAPAVSPNESTLSQESGIGLDHPSYAALEEKLTLAEQQSHEYWEKCTRLSAELDNVRRRAEKENMEAHRYGATHLIKQLLPVVDSLEQALASGDQSSHGAMYDGLVLTQKLFVDTLQKSGVAVIDPAGLPFDPKEHEAMSIIATEDHAPNTVMTVFQKGYRLHDRVIRAAKVIVTKAPG